MHKEGRLIASERYTYRQIIWVLEKPSCRQIQRWQLQWDGVIIDLSWHMEKAKTNFELSWLNWDSIELVIN